MQAAISLCYFCENHGPRVVMICQPIRHGLHKKSVNLANDDEELPQFYGDIGSYQTEIVDDEKRCAACSSFGGGLGILSNDHEAETSYVSTQMPINNVLHDIVKQSCLRSLSVEISTPLFIETGLNSTDYFLEPCSSMCVPHIKNICNTNTSKDLVKEFSDKDGVVLFGDDENGYTLSHTFRLKDAKARGFSRSYSLIVMSRDKLMLLSNYEFFLGGFSAMISILQLMACKCFSMEQKMDNDLRMVASTQNVNRVPWLPHQFYPRHFVLDTSRSLTEITDNKEIFTLLHRQMLYLLKTQTTLERDTVLEGVPTQDMLVLMEMEQNSLEENDLVTSLTTQQSFLHLNNLKIIVKRFKALANNSSLLTALIWQIIVGGQVVIKSDIPIARRLFLLALVHLLPVGCVRLASNSLAYMHTYKYNFLGCPSNIVIPEEVCEEVFVIALKPKATQCNNSTSYSGMKINNVEADNRDGKNNIFKENLNNFDFCIEFCPKKFGLQPRLLGRYMQLLLNPILNICTLESVLRATRNDWLNNSKLIYQLRHQKEKVDINKIIKIIKCSSQDLPVLLFWQSGLSRRYKQVILNTINVNSSFSTGANLSNARLHTGNKNESSPNSSSLIKVVKHTSVSLQTSAPASSSTITPAVKFTSLKNNKIEGK